MIAVVVLTHDRVHLLERCVSNVLKRTSPHTVEIVIWDNGSTDGTGEFLSTLTDPRITVVHHDENIGQNGYARAFELTTAEYLIEVDDDVIDAPPEWDRTLLEAFTQLPDVGFLAADLVDDPHDEAAHLRHHVRPDAYTRRTVNGIDLLFGPVGGGCAITSRELNRRVGGFRQQKKGVFWLEDAAYIADIAELGYRAAYLAGLRVHHAGGPYYAKPNRSKLALVERYRRETTRKNAVKRALLRIAPVRRLNERHGWFSPPDEAWEEYLAHLSRSLG
jgi:hypothetical protein